MIRFTKFPADFTPLHEGLLFEVECDEPSDVEVCIYEAQTETLVGRKMLYGVSVATIDIAPYVARIDDVVPLALDCSAIVPASVGEYRVEANGISSGVICVSNNLTLPLAQGVITTAPTERHIAYGECDEVRIISRLYVPIFVSLTTDEGFTMTLDFTSSPGYATLFFATSDLPATTRRAEMCIFCDEIEVQRITYHFAPHYGAGFRLAWLSEVGSVERYTFPTICRTTRSAERTECRTAEGETFGIRSLRDTCLRLSSAIEPRATIVSLAGIVASPRTWRVEAGEPTRVEVLSTEAVSHTFGRPDRVVVDVRTAREEVAI
jgi:hypothetical protein